MTELLALPGWDRGPTPLSAWVEALQRLGVEVVVERESPGVSWIEAGSIGLRGYAVTDGLAVEAINFELTGDDPGPARRVIEQAAESVSWEVHEDDEEDEDDDPST